MLVTVSNLGPYVVFSYNLQDQTLQIGQKVRWSCTLLLGILFQFMVFIFIFGIGVSCWGSFSTMTSFSDDGEVEVVDLCFIGGGKGTCDGIVGGVGIFGGGGGGGGSEGPKMKAIVI